MSSERLGEAVTALHDVMHRLRMECPWDRVQTHASLRRYLLEECHEVLAALDEGSAESLKGELGDLLFQIWFHAEIASEPTGLGFDLTDVLDGVREKLIRRHPHVFSDSEVVDAEEVQRNWERRKLEEGRRSRLDGVPATLPALLMAQNIQRKAATVGFDWPDAQGAWQKLEEESAELAEAASAEVVSVAAMEEELGDLLFSVVNLARKLDLDAESALLAANRKFRRRFGFIEKSETKERPLEQRSLEELDALWNDAKRSEG